MCLGCESRLALVVSVLFVLFMLLKLLLCCHVMLIYGAEWAGMFCCELIGWSLWRFKHPVLSEAQPSYSAAFRLPDMNLCCLLWLLEASTRLRRIDRFEHVACTLADWCECETRLSQTPERLHVLLSRLSVCVSLVSLLTQSGWEKLHVHEKIRNKTDLKRLFSCLSNIKSCRPNVRPPGGKPGLTPNLD